VLEPLAGAVPSSVLDAVRSFSFLSQMNTITSGVIDVRALTFFGSLIGGSLLANAIVLDLKKAD
jgi:anti-anti-sigma regulatory factor